MQGQRSAKGSLPESLGFDDGSTSSDAGIIDQQIFWNNMRNPAQNRASDYTSPSNTSDMYLNPSSQEGQSLSVWSVGGPSSGSVQNQVSHGEQKTEHGWSSSLKPCAGAGPNLEAQHYGPASIFSLDDVNLNLSRNQIANGPLFLQSSSSDPIPQDFDVNSSFVGTECPNAYMSGSSENLRVATAGSSSNPFGVPSGVGGCLEEETDGRHGCSLEGRRLSRKRKAIEVDIGQSSESGSSNFFQRPEGSVWHVVPARQNANSNLIISTPSEDTLHASPSEQVIPRLGLAVGQVASENPLALSAETTHRNIRLRINPSHQQVSIPTNNVLTTGSSVGNSNLSSPYLPSRPFSLNNSVNLRPPAAVDNSTPQGQSVLRVPALRRNMQSSRWNRSSNPRPGRSPRFLISGERDAASASNEEFNLRSVPRNISEHPIFVPATEMRNSTQNEISWGLTGANASSAGNVASTSQTGSSSGAHPLSAPNWVPHRNSPQYPRRLSEVVRRSLLSPTDSEAGAQTNNVSPPLSGMSASSQEVALPSGVGNQGHRLSHSRSAVLLDRHLDGPFGIPYSMRTLAAASEGRSRLVSEIRNVLDLMRRGEGLRFEDVMLLDQSVFYGMADIHDRHRDMRLDIDNMSYEELLALEEHIGNVNTGLSEETIVKRLKQRKYVTTTMGQLEAEPCCICQEQYSNGEDLGTLECGHDFHTHCIKQWLAHKNSCPICKSTALAA